MEIQLTLDRSRRIPLSLQIAHGIRDAIFAQQLIPGTRLPPTRELAERLQVSRAIVVEAYEWLAADGYVESRPGSGVYISQALSLTQPSAHSIDEPARRTDLLPENPIQLDFRSGLPALDLFPRKDWKAALASSLSSAEAIQLGYGPVEGLPRLRRDIAEYAARTRGLPVAPERVVITVGATQAMDLMLRTLTSPQALPVPIQCMAVENPGPEPIRRLMHLNQIRAYPIPVDENGMRVDLLPDGSDAPHLVHVVPSHQYPSGWAMSLERRIELLNWAVQQDAVILEDDYDSEFRFDRQPPIALAALDSTQRVVYFGTFSKTMFPGLRLGFCILPEKFIDTFLNLKWFSDRCVPVIEQLALASWLESGLFERHTRKMRSVYAQRRSDLVDALHQHFGSLAQVAGVAAGMHMCVTFDLGLSEDELLAKALPIGIKVYPVSACYLGETPRPPALILGYGNLSSADLFRGIAMLATVWKKR